MDGVPMQWPAKGQISSTGSLVRTILLLLNLFLVLLMVWLWRNSPQAISTHEAPKVQTPPLQLPASPLRTLSFNHYQELLARPLFWSDRRALQNVSTVDAETPSQPLAFVLIGAVTSPQSSYALLGKTGSSEVIKAQPGDVVDGWELESMTADSVNFLRGGERRQIVLEKERVKGQ